MPLEPCKECGTTDQVRLYASGRMKRCKDCQRFYNITVNARKVRKHGRQPQLAMSKDEFISWATSRDARCVYCGVPESNLERLGLKSSIYRPVAALGVDRRDNDGDYAIDNIEFCCYACNKAKGNVFSHEEMLQKIGPAIAKIWSERLAVANLPPSA